MVKLDPQQTIELAQRVYGVQDERVKELKWIFQQTQKEIIEQISYFISKKINWETTAPKKERDELMDQLSQIVNSADDNDQSLIQTAFKGQKSKSQGDLLLASITLALIDLGLTRKKQLNDSVNYIPRVVNASNYKVAKQIVEQQPKSRPPSQVRSLPSANINQVLQKTTKNAVIDRDFLQQNYATINKQTIQTITQVRDVAVRAAQSTEPDLKFADEVANILTGGSKKTNGQMGRAQGMVRTVTSQVINRQKRKDYKKRNVKKYKFLSLEAVTTCNDCNSLDGKIFNVDDAQEGVNYPPIHLNCQCDTQEIIDDKYLSGQIDVSDELQQLQNELNSD